MNLIVASIVHAFEFGQFRVQIILSVLLLFGAEISVVKAQCTIYSMRAGSSSYSCGGGVGSTVAMGGSSVGNTYQLIRNGSTAIGDLVQGTGASTMKWIVYQPGTYTVVAYGGSCGGGTLMNGSTVITDLGPPPAVRINAQQSTYVCQGQIASFSVENCSGCSWYFNGEQTGVTGNGYSPPTDQAGTHTITVSGFNACNTFQSDDVVLNVQGYPLAVIVPQGATTICQGSSLVLQGQTDGIFFEWLKNGQPIASATSAIYTATEGGAYSMKASFTGTDCQTTSAAISVNMIPTPKASILPAGEVMIPFGEVSAHLVANDGVGALTYKWYKNGRLIGADGMTLDAIASGDYTVQTKTPEGCINTSSATTVTFENSYNYIITRKLTVNKNSNGSAIAETDLSGLSKDQEQVSITYYDGLGRPMQMVEKRKSPIGHDIVQPVAYDLFGRESSKYLPYVADAANGAYKVNALGASELDYPNSPQYKFYKDGSFANIASDSDPSAQVIFEASPLNRIQKQGAPGEAWQNKMIEKRYGINADDEVLLIKYNGINDVLTADGYYGPRELLANVVVDENTNEVIEYVDKQGRIVCKKVQYGINGAAKLYASTYYVYDDNNMLIEVLPPEAIVEILKQY